MNLETFLELINGKKTYIISACAVVVIALGVFGVISNETVEKLLEIIGVSSVITLRHAIAKSE